jgi:hypothetical protein
VDVTDDSNTMIMRIESSLLWIRIGFIADPDPVPDPAFCLNANPDFIRL